MDGVNNSFEDMDNHSWDDIYYMYLKKLIDIV